MLNNTVPPSTPLSVQGFSLSNSWKIFAAAVFLVSVPVFIQAPLVRHFPLISLAVSALLAGVSYRLKSHPRYGIWGDLLLGFTGSWLCGTLYWGWFRSHPVIHLPIEALAVPLAWWSLKQQKNLIGSWFYLGSLFGTAITDLYFWVVGLIPHWRQVMQVEPSLALPIFHSATLQVQTPWGLFWAVTLAVLLLVAGVIPLRSPQLHSWAFGAAVLSTILVDSLFWLAANAA